MTELRGDDVGAAFVTCNVCCPNIISGSFATTSQLSVVKPAGAQAALEQGARLRPHVEVHVDAVPVLICLP
jgi:hypothetical protein